VPNGLPSLTVPDVSRADLDTLALSAVAIFVVAFSDAILTARSFAARHHEVVDANQELLALGVAQVSAGVTQGLPVGTSGSRTAVNDDIGSDEPGQRTGCRGDDRRPHGRAGPAGRLAPTQKQPDQGRHEGDGHAPR
jgi:Sulfate permease family